MTMTASARVERTVRREISRGELRREEEEAVARVRRRLQRGQLEDQGLFLTDEEGDKEQERSQMQKKEKNLDFFSKKKVILYLMKKLKI